MWSFRIPTAADIEHIAAHMREEDAREVMASHGHTPLQALAWAVTTSDLCRTIVWKQTPTGLMGYARCADAGASVWLLGTDALIASSRRKSFLRISRHILDVWADAFGVLFNYVDARAVTSRRWLRWMGFVEHAPVPYGPDSIPFIPIVKTHV